MSASGTRTVAVTPSQGVATTPRAAATSQAPIATSQAVVTSRAVTQVITSQVITSQDTTTSSRRTASTRRQGTSSAATVIPSTIPYDASAERRADSRQTNKILIGIFSVLGVVLLGLAVFQVLRCYKRRKRDVPLPPPRDPMSYRQSRGVSIYKEFPSAELSRPPSLMMRHGSGSGLVATPSIRSYVPSVDAKPNELTKSPDSDTSVATMVDSPLADRSQSPLVVPRPESRGWVPRPNSVASTSRHSYLGPPSRHGSMVRHSVHDPYKRASYYASGNHGAPHTPHARDRVGLVMPQPLAPELFNYAPDSPRISPNEHDQALQPRKLARTDSWIARCTSYTACIQIQKLMVVQHIHPPLLTALLLRLRTRTLPTGVSRLRFHDHL